MSERRPDDLEQLVAELAATLDELDDRLDGTPDGRERLLRFTERYAIPTAIATLETNIRVLEAVAGAIRLSQGREPSHDARDSAAPLGVLNRTLSEMDDVVRGQPPDDDARRLLADARDLRDEIRGRIDEVPDDRRQSPRRRPTGEDSDSSDRDTGGTPIPVSEASADSSVDVDVDRELDRLREQVDDEK